MSVFLKYHIYVGKIIYRCYFSIVYIKMIETKTHSIKRDLGNIVIVTHLHLVRGSELNEINGSRETVAQIYHRFYGTELDRIWWRNHDDADKGLFEALCPVIRDIEPAKLWRMRKSKLDKKCLEVEYAYAQNKVDEIVAGSTGEWARALVCSLPFYLQLARGYAQLKDDSSWTPERAAAIAKECFGNMYQQVCGYIAGLISNDNSPENDQRRVIPASLYLMDISSTAQALRKYTGITVEDPELRKLYEMYERGVDAGKIKDGPEW